MTTQSAVPLDSRMRARAVLIMFGLTLTMGIVLLVAFEPEVQTIDPRELVARQSDARQFLVADYLFIAFYAVLSPIAIWRFGATFTGGSPPVWIKLTALVLVAAGVVDATENALLLSATDSVSEGAVDAAHALEIPKTTLFIAGTLLAIVANIRAAGALVKR
jgi:hypothetical protein